MSTSSSASAQPSAAAQKYLGITAPIDSDLQAFLALPDTTSAATAKAAAGKVAKDETTLLTQLKKISWPSAAQPDITTLERTATSEQVVYSKCAAASSVAAIKSVLVANKATIAARVAAATHVRTALGVPNTTSPATASPSA